MSSTINPAGLAWRKSSYSGNSEGQCVEVGELAPAGLPGVAVRDSKVKAGPVLSFGTAAFAAFVDHARTAA